MYGYIGGLVAAVIAGYLAGLLHVRKLPPHPAHCSEATWCTNCGMTTGTRCREHKIPAPSTSDPAERR